MRASSRLRHRPVPFPRRCRTTFRPRTCPRPCSLRATRISIPRAIGEDAVAAFDPRRHDNEDLAPPLGELCSVKAARGLLLARFEDLYGDCHGLTAKFEMKAIEAAVRP